jgi:osmotically-inducible protein OsmY
VLRAHADLAASKPGGKRVNNNKLERDVLDELLWDDSIDASRINVHSDGTTVTLTGFVSTYYELSNAGDDAWRVNGVTHVQNDVLVDPAAERVRDEDLVTSATAGLKANRLVPKAAITVTANDGWITMKGNVRHRFQRQAAEHVIRYLRGLQGLTDLVTVSRDPAADVSGDVSKALARNAAIDAEKVSVTDVAGTVTLNGSVRSFAERQEAERAAWAAPGVVNVIDNLAIAS